MAPPAPMVPYRIVETYRVSDPIENMQLRVTLRRRTTGAAMQCGSSAGASTGSRKKKGKGRFRRDSAAEGADESDDEGAPGTADERGEGERAGLLGAADVSSQEAGEELACEPRVFHWQERAFSPTEVAAVQGADGSSSPRRSLSSSLSREPPKPRLSPHARELLAELDMRWSEAGRGPYTGEMIYSKLHSESLDELDDWISSFTDSTSEAPTPLARAVVSGQFMRQHRDMLGEVACVSMSIFAELPANAFDPDGKRGSDDDGGRLSSIRRSIARLASPRSSRGGPTAGVEVPLAVLRLYPGGRLDMKPGLSIEPLGPTLPGDAPPLSKWYQIPNTKYEYQLENIAEGLESSEARDDAAHSRIAKLHHTAHTAISKAIPDGEFKAPPLKAARVHHFIEIESADNFGETPLYIAWYALAAPGWRLMPGCAPSAVTQTSYTAGEEQRAVFGFPLELNVESDAEPNAARPPLSLFFVVLNFDSWGRHQHLGYAHATFQPTSGSERVEVRAWRLSEDRVDALRSYFVGGTQELSDLRAISIPDGFELPCLNKHGLDTVTTGRITLNARTLVQQYQPAIMQPRTQRAEKKASERVRERADLGPLKGAVGVNRLGRSETAADRVKKRLEERRRAEGR